jgi:tetratricopeptide (TPR) repeat protein
VLEIRAGEGTGSIVTTGHFQTDLVGLESAVKDSARFPGGWGYFAFQTDANGASQPAKVLPRTAACYGCHAEHAAVENTFTQFYPTLFPVARAKGKVREDFIGIPASSAELVDAVTAHGWPAGEKLLAETAASWPTANLLREPTLNTTGYRLLAAGKRAEAIHVFEYITRRAPASANAWDSLAEAYEGANRPADALAAAARGLAALSGDQAVAPAQRGNLERSLTERRDRLRAKK